MCSTPRSMKNRILSCISRVARALLGRVRYVCTSSGNATLSALWGNEAINPAGSVRGECLFNKADELTDRERLD